MKETKIVFIMIDGLGDISNGSFLDKTCLEES
jgi:2,3-bisphosphoglycerate-independent phosphoglycerate mutase